MRVSFFAAAILVASAPASATTINDLAPIYDVSFDDGTLTPSIDANGFGALKLGSSQTANSAPTFAISGGELALGITQPVILPLPIVSGGAFATPVNFGVGSVFGLRARFVGPTGPHQNGNIWAVVLGARTGDEDDLSSEIRTAATLQIRGSGARLNTPGATINPNLSNVPQSVYDLLFDPTSPQIFTLELFVDRMLGVGTATLKVKDFLISTNFSFAAFTGTGGPPITAVGPSIAMVNGSGQTASVRVLDFQILGVPVAVPEPVTWAMMISGFGLIGVTLRRRGHALRSSRIRKPVDCGIDKSIT